jgi:hypothetical protein
VVNGQAVFLLPSTNTNASFLVQAFNANAPANNPQVTFSPRGTTTLREPLTLEFARDGVPINRCLRIDPLLGFLSIGGLNGSQPTAGLDCPDNSFDGVL